MKWEFLYIFCTCNRINYKCGNHFGMIFAHTHTHKLNSNHARNIRKVFQKLYMHAPYFICERFVFYASIGFKRRMGQMGFVDPLFCLFRLILLMKNRISNNLKTCADA
jgi:hypothetical protein